jgi:hypothetical protein
MLGKSLPKPNEIVLSVREVAMKIVIPNPKPRNVAAKALAQGQYRPQVVRDKKMYSRKGRTSSMRKFEDSV